MKPHPTDLLSLVPGLVAVAVATIALTGGLTLDLLATEWLWPAVLVVLGVLVLASAGIGHRPRAGHDTVPGDDVGTTSDLDEDTDTDVADSGTS